MTKQMGGMPMNPWQQHSGSPRPHQAGPPQQMAGQGHAPQYGTKSPPNQQMH